MLIEAIEIILAIFTVFGIYSFIKNMMDLAVEILRHREAERIKKIKRKEEEDEHTGYDDRG